MIEPTIYLIGLGGGAKTNVPGAVSALERIGMRRCDKSEYRKYMRRTARSEAARAKRAARPTGIQKIMHDAKELQQLAESIANGR